MLDALRIIVKNGALVLFLILQIICFYWIVKYNQRQSQIYFYSGQVYSNLISLQYQSILNYFSLQQKNDSLAEENKLLLKRTFDQINKSNLDTQLHTLSKNLYEIIPANVVNNSLVKRNNTITLDKGSNDGVSKGMGVITVQGVVGIITDVSEHFSLVLSLLHSKSRISCKIPKSGFIGTMVWDGKDPMKLQLEDIQRYALINIGDSIVTSGYSIIFPQDISVGKITSFHVEPGAFTYTIEATPTQSFFNLDQVYIINHPYRSEKENLEHQSEKYE
ncbi:MAG: rod shape-determining protein MreC [Saprospiraceae bacterium]|nr:rod shape-determining protein MreC [Saprospiraceae bacterium]